jgi:nitrogen regulatory protein P-II 1
MKKVEATIKPFKLNEVRDAIVDLGIDGMTVTEVKEVGPHARTACYRGSEYVVFAPELKVEIVLADDRLARCIDVLTHVAGNDHKDGRIVVLEVEDTIRIRNGEHLARAA